MSKLINVIFVGYFMSKTSHQSREEKIKFNDVDFIAFHKLIRSFELVKFDIYKSETSNVETTVETNVYFRFSMNQDDVKIDDLNTAYSTEMDRFDELVNELSQSKLHNRINSMQLTKMLDEFKSEDLSETEDTNDINETLNIILEGSTQKAKDEFRMYFKIALDSRIRALSSKL